MKQVTAIIKPFRLNEVRDAQNAIGVSGLTVTQVQGYGRQRGQGAVYRGPEYEVKFIPKLKVEVLVVAHDGEEGLSLLLNSSVDLVLSDINMPGMSGFEVLEKFKELAPDSPIPFIFLTGLGDRDDEIAGRMLGADDYVRKPVDFEILQTIIAARLRGAAPLVPGSTSGALSDREREALTWAARGKTREEIGHIMNITKRTVEFHLDNAQIKLGVKTRIEAAVRASIQGLIDP